MKVKNEATSTVVAKINDVSIVLIDNGQKVVPVKPICEILNVDWATQFQKLKDDEILGSVIGLSPTTGSDGKQYEMVTIPLQYVFGWLFTINPKNVNPEARESVIKYKKQCYDVLYSHFVEYQQFIEEKQTDIAINNQLITEARRNFRNARTVVNAAEKKMKEVIDLTFQQWKDSNRVQKLPLAFSE